MMKSTELQRLVEDAANPHAGARQTRAAARLMSLLESEPHRLPDVFQHLSEEAWPRPRLVLGITGAPGSGKSTLTDALIAAYRTRHPERKVGAIAVDPSSPFTGGAVLGDRVRMMRHAEDASVFIRSLASRGHLGGLSLGVRGVLRVMGLIGCDLVIVETVGVGQSEVEVAGVADQVLVILAPGQGDAVQMLKAGLLEIADIFVINKADTPGADKLKSALVQTLGMAHMHRRLPEAGEEDASDLARDVFLVSAVENTGVDTLFDELERRTDRNAGRWQSFRDERVIEEVRDAVVEHARRRLRDTLNENGSSESLRRVLKGELSVADLTDQILDKTRSASR